MVGEAECTRQKTQSSCLPHFVAPESLSERDAHDILEERPIQKLYNKTTLVIIVTLYMLLHHFLFKKYIIASCRVLHAFF